MTRRSQTYLLAFDEARRQSEAAGGSPRYLIDDPKAPGGFRIAEMPPTRTFGYCVLRVHVPLEEAA
jgi:hypothetical protein